MEALPSGNPTTVLISEASRMHCELLNMAFSTVRERFHVVGAVSSGTHVLTALQVHRPQVVVVSDDLEDGPLAGIRILPEIRATHADIKILLLMGAPDQDLVVEAFRLGADGVFCRDNPFDLLCKSLDAISRGEIWATASELRSILDEFARAPKPLKMDPAVERRMTKREGEVARFAAEGLSNREIGEKLGLTEHTVKNHLFRIFDKLGVSNRVELVLACLRQEQGAREERVGTHGWAHVLQSGREQTVSHLRGGIFRPERAFTS